MSDVESDREDEGESYKGTPAAVILINGYDCLSNGATKQSYSATCELIKNYMRISSPELVGVCFYGVNLDSSSLGLEGLLQIFALTTPTLKEFKQLVSLKISNLTQAKELKLSDAIWHCSKMFANCKKLLSTKTVIMLSRMDVPPEKGDQKPTLKRIVDLVDSGIQLKVVNVAETIYPVDSFYKTLMIEAHKGNEVDVPKPIWVVNDIVKLLQQHSHRHLALARLCFDVGDGFAFGVGVYSIQKPKPKPKHVTVNKDTNQILKTKNTEYKKKTDTADDSDLDENEGDDNNTRLVPLLKSETLYYQIFGDERVEFSDEEIRKLKNPFGDPKLKLLGFKPSSFLQKEKWFMLPCHFLYPNESIIEGSTVAFKAFHQACTEMTVIAICVLCTRVNAKPKIVAISPCTKPFGFDIKIGFDVIYLPFVENVRSIPPYDNTETNINQSQKQVMKQIITAMKFDYRPDMIENPALQSLYEEIEALALEKEERDPTFDTTKCNPNLYQKSEYIDNAEDFNKLFGPYDTESKSAKRPGASTNNTGAKRERREITEIDEELLDLRLSSNTINKYTVKELQQILYTKNPPNLPALTGLKKAELVELINKCLGN